ncbi:MAG TPA: GNAT family N-acetyltransferase [Geminicoccaceae bacterium]|nr:GNAT family N-acetyltransferase [Geminicoccaceae bacterium]
MTVHVRAASSAADREACFAIRIAVFVDEQQGVPADAELDGHEPTATHLLAFSGGRPAGTLRWRMVPPSAAKIERVAVLREARSLGVGRALLAEALRQVAATPAITEAATPAITEAMLHAQTRAQAFYRRFGFVAEGDPFDEDGIEHVRMSLAPVNGPRP